jgi:hypothetical protein
MSILPLILNGLWMKNVSLIIREITDTEIDSDFKQGITNKGYFILGHKKNWNWRYLIGIKIVSLRNIKNIISVDSI